MNANQYSIRPNRPNQFFAAGAAMLASTLVLSSVLWLFSGDLPAAAANAAVVVQQHAAANRG
jgi:hypothetical protein